MKINRDILKESVEELEQEAVDMKSETRMIDKTAFNLNVDPSSIVGALTGALTGAFLTKGKINRDEEARKQKELFSPSPIEGGYYSQVNNMVSNLKVIFTPLSAIYVLQNGAVQTTIETIGTDEMNDDMYKAWQSRDSEYFKTLMLNKMHGELQFVEQQFAKRIIANQLKIKESLTKKASYISDNLSIVELAHHINDIKEFYNVESESVEKIASILESVSDFPKEVITPNFKRPIEQYASFAEPLSFLGITFNDGIDSLQENYLNPRYLKNRIKIGFLPDRIVFIVDNKVLKSMLAMDMNPESFDMFKKQKSGYFEKMFDQEIEDGVKRMRGDMPHDQKKEIGSDILKSAEYKAQDIFYTNIINPIIYDKVLMSKYGDKWAKWELSVLVKSIEMDFGLTEPIHSIPLNKIYSVHAIRNSHVPFKTPHVFEKIIRSFSGKHIDFSSDERDDVGAVDILNGLDSMEALAGINIYKKISVDVKNYIVKCLCEDGFNVFMPAEFISGKVEADFYDNLNKTLLSETISKECSGVKNIDLRSKNVQSNEIISHTAITILTEIFKNDIDIEINEIDELDTYLEHFDKNISDIIKIQIKNNLIISKYLKKRHNELEEQAWKYL